MAEEGHPPWQAGGFGDELAAAATRFLGAGRIEVGGEVFRMSCSEMVRAAFAAEGCTEGPTGAFGDGGTATLFEYCKDAGLLHRESAAPGDLVIFDNTYDRNRNRKSDDPLSHVGIVTGGRDDGTVIFVHVGSGRIRKGHMNLERPWARKDKDGNALNDQLRARKKNDPKGTRYMAGELFRAYCRPEPCGE